MCLPVTLLLMEWRPESGVGEGGGGVYCFCRVRLVVVLFTSLFLCFCDFCVFDVSCNF